MLYEDKTEVLLGCFFDVQNEVGLGRQEPAYQRACELWLEENSIPYRSKPTRPLRLGGQVAHKLFPDLVVWDSITVELKAVPRDLHDTEFVQIFDYLKCRGDRLGLLVNMGLDRVHHERLIYDPPTTELEENWDYWTGSIEGSDRQIGVEVREALRSIYQEHGTGYGSEIMEKLIAFELDRRGLSFATRPVAKSFFRGIEVDAAPLDCLVIEGCLLLTFTALFEGNDFGINRGKSFMKALGVPWGVAANFGKKKAQISGLRQHS